MGTLKGKSEFFRPGPPALPGEAHAPIVQFLLKELRGKAVLDIGGGRGAYSLELKRNGFEPTVLDIDGEALAVAQNNGLSVRQIAPDEVLEENCADTVMLIEVLEHVDDPAQFLRNAIRYARKRVLFTLPCTDDFDTLFAMNLSYAHIAVSDHLNHYSRKEMEALLDSVGNPYRLDVGDYLFPHASMLVLSESFSCGVLGKLAMLPIRVLNKLGFVKKRFPSRFYGIIEV